MAATGAAPPGSALLAGLAFSFEAADIKPGAPRRLGELAAPAARAGQQQQQQQRGPQAQPAAPPPSAGLSALKLASLRRRAAVLAERQADEPAAPEPRLSAVPSQFAPRGSSSTAAAAATPAAVPDQAAEEERRRRQQHEQSLLQGTERALAGCASRVCDDPPPEAGLALLLLNSPAGTATCDAAAPGDPAAPQGLAVAGGAAVDGSDSGAGCAPAEPQAPAAAAAAADASPQAAAAASLHELPPATLEDALSCLGLLPDATDGIGSSGPPPASSTAQWVRLRAVGVVLSSKWQAVVAAELRPLAQRLRHGRLHLEFHKANMQRGAAGSGAPRAPAVAPGPWLSGRSSVVASKHRASGSGSPGGSLGPRPKMAGPTAEASALQVQLLGALRPRLLLKLGLEALRQAAASARLRRQLLLRADALAAADLARLALRSWHATVVPSPAQFAAAHDLARQHAQRRQRAQLAAWRAWAAHCAWQQRQLGHGQRQLRARLLGAAVQHWRCYCQLMLVQRLHTAAAARWAAAWGRRRVFAAWRQAARRSAALKAALLTRSLAGGAAGAGDQQAPQPLPSQQETLAATAAAFVPVKALVADASQQLRQLQQGLRWAPRLAAAHAEAEQPGGEALPLPPELGVVESLLAALPPPVKAAQPARQQQLQPPAAAAAAAEQPQPFGSPAAASAAGPVAAAPDPGSPTLYNPACYASPARDATRQQQQQRAPRGAAEAGGARGGGLALGEREPAAVEGELLECQDEVAHLGAHLAELGGEAQALQAQCTQLEAAAAEQEQASGQLRQAAADAAAARDAAAAAMRAATQQHVAAAAERSAAERLARQRLEKQRAASAAEAGARAAVLAATEQQAMAGIAVQRWSKAVEAAAKELAATHRTQQAAVIVRLKESRQRLEQARQQAADAQVQLPPLQAAALEAAQQAQQAHATVAEAQQQLVDASQRGGQLRQHLDRAVSQHEAAAVAAVAAEQAAASAEQQQRLLAAQQAATVGRLRQTVQLVMRKQQEAAQLAKRVEALQQRHRTAVAAMLAAGERQQRRGKLKRRLQVVQEGADAAVPSPTAVQQRRQPPAPAAAAVAQPPTEAAALAAPPADVDVPPAAGPLALSVPERPVWADWSCSSSELGSPTSEEQLPPLTVDEAAARFYTLCLLRRALHVLRHAAASRRAAMQAADARWRQRRQAAVLLAWRAHASAAADWLHDTGTALRRRWLLRQWRAVVAERQWQRDAEAVADAWVRQRTLAAAVAAWRQCVRHELWRDAVHEAVVQQRLRHVISGWRAWTRRRRQKAARERAASAVYERRLLAAALRQWRWVQRSKALLHRVFSTAVELWREEVGVRLHQRNFGRVQAAWAAWQLFVLQAQEQRRQGMLANAAAAFRERQLLGAGLAAFRQAVADAREARRLACLRLAAFGAWRQQAATSARHFSYEAARHHRRDQLARAALGAWRAGAEETAALLARFWLKWQVQALLRRVLRGWREVAAAQAAARGAPCSIADAPRAPALLLQQGPAASGAAAAEQPGRLAQQSVLHQQPQPWPPPPQQPLQQQQPAPAASCISIEIRQQRQHIPSRHQQEQRPPAAAASSTATCDDWRAAAEYWRERHERLKPPPTQQQPRQPAAARSWTPAVSASTAATLRELRAQQHER